MYIYIYTCMYIYIHMHIHFCCIKKWHNPAYVFPSRTLPFLKSFYDIEELIDHLKQYEIRESPETEIPRKLRTPNACRQAVENLGSVITNLLKTSQRVRDTIEKVKNLKTSEAQKLLGLYADTPKLLPAVAYAEFPPKDCGEVQGAG